MIKRQSAFQKGGVFLKGNLHCHSSLSDGTASPAEVIRNYAEKGFDYSCISALYYQAFEEAYNKLIWNEYADRGRM